jgi:hypothetical protein
MSWTGMPLPPVGAGSFDVKGDILPDGRIVAVTGASVYLERARGSGVFDAVGILDSSEIGSATDPAFLRISPGGDTIAIGGGFGKPVAVFGVQALGTPGLPVVLTSGSVASYFDIAHYEAQWRDGSHLAVTAGEFGSPAFVSLLDVRSDPGAPVNPVIIEGIGGAPAGIAFDAAGWLYTGNGFDLDPSSGSETGAVRAFAPELWGGGAADFESAGVFVGDVLSASALLFDLEGNLIVGGGEVPGDAGYLGVINADALTRALGGLGPIDASDPLQLRRLDPLGTGDGYFGAAYDRTTGMLFATDGSLWHGTIPGPGAASLLFAACILNGRRRHD